MIPSHIKDIKLAKKGNERIAWAISQMPVLKLIRDRFAKEKPLRKIILGACLHITTETANLLLTLKTGGAKVIACASNPLSTQDDVAASLVKDYEIPVFAIKGENRETYYRHLNLVLDFCPQITMDDGADLISVLHQKRTSQIKEVIGSTEETTTGVIRLRAMEKANQLKIPVIAVNDSDTKHLFDNRYGTGQSTIDGILRATNILLAGKTFTVLGYGMCGKGLSARAKGMGANVIVVETNPVLALEALMDGYRVMTVNEAAKISDLMVTVTGNKNVISKGAFSIIKNGCILANAGHFNVEIDIPVLEKMSRRNKKVKDYVQEYQLKNGKKIYLLAEGRLINLVAAEGHPALVMDMSFTNQALAAEYLVNNKGNLEAKVYRLPEEIDREIAKLKLKSLGIKTQELTQEQLNYLSSWEEGT